MLYHLLFPLREQFSIFNVIRYLTFRSLSAFVIALVFVLVFQPRFIAWFRKRQLAQPIRSDGPQTHHSKAGTPTMGGLIVVIAVLLATILFADLTNSLVWITCGVTLSYGALGFIDDFRKVRVRSSAGVRAKTKLLWQILFAAGFVWLLLALNKDFSTTVTIPFFKDAAIDLGWLFVPFAAFVIVGCSNAVNLTDGLDGLVIGPIMTVAAPFDIGPPTCGIGGVPGVAIGQTCMSPILAAGGILNFP